MASASQCLAGDPVVKAAPATETPGVEKSAVEKSPVEKSDLDLQKEAARGFYSVVISFADGGLPTVAQVEKLSPFVSKELKKLLLGAIDAQEIYKRAATEPEPPFVEGAFYCSLAEGAQRVGQVTPETEATERTLLVSLEYGDPKDPKELTKWEDKVTLVNEDGKWVIEDLEFLGKWDFSNKGKLSEHLKYIISQKP